MIKNKDNYLTCNEAAKIAGLSADYLRKLILHGKLKADRLGRNWIIQMKDVVKIKRQRMRRIKGT